jgi:hypothetical protein
MTAIGLQPFQYSTDISETAVIWHVRGAPPKSRLGHISNTLAQRVNDIRNFPYLLTL